jgi:hypothetical protein
VSVCGGSGGRGPGRRGVTRTPGSIASAVMVVAVWKNGGNFFLIIYCNLVVYYFININIFKHFFLICKNKNSMSI